VPGDPERRSAEERKASGISIDSGTLGQLVEAAKSAGVPQDLIDGFAPDA
jgi:uncharacterized oxidoreductase